MGKFTAYNDNYWMCDFETLTTNTKYYKENNATKIWLAYAKRFSINGQEYEEEILTVDIKSFFDTFFKKGVSATLFFHNLSWDGEFIKWYLVENGYKYFHELPKRKTCKGFMVFEDTSKIYYINIFRPVRVKNQIKIVQLYIRCSLNLLTLSVEKLGQILKTTTKQTINYHVEGYNSIEEVPQNEIDYIKADVNIVIPFLQQYNEVFKVKIGNRIQNGLAKLTIGGTSISMFKSFIYKKIRFKENFFLPYEEVINLQHWYSGGLTTYPKNYQYDITKNLNGKVYDVNSMYPSVMVEHYYPIGSPVYSKNRPNIEYKIHMVKIFIKRAQIKSEDYPYLLRKWVSATYTYPVNSRLVGYTENAIAYYFIEELESLKRFYDIEYEVMEDIWFKGEKYFKDFITENYKLRQKYKKEKDPRQQTIKLLLNNCYGKFGQRPDKTTIIYSEKEFEKGDTIIQTKDNELIVDVVRNKDSCIGNLNSYVCYWKNPKRTSINVAIAACITMHARVKLHNAIWENKENFLYCDTDSVFLKDEAKGLDIDPTNLGAWDLEIEFDKFELGGAKMYNLYVGGVRKKSAHCGISSKWALENLKETDIITINKKLGVGSKKLHHKVKGGVVIEETEYTIKARG